MMVFSRQYTMKDLAMGMTAIAAIGETERTNIDNVFNRLLETNHETLYEAAREIADEYGFELVALNMTIEELGDDWCAGFLVAEVEGTHICGLCDGDGRLLMPPQMQHIDKKPDTVTVIRARRISRVMH